MTIDDARITADHRSRSACVYVRQSTGDQVQNNLESQRLQYGLADRARDLVWSQVEAIDEDLGRSAAGGERPGFERLLVAVCSGTVGIVLSSGNLSNALSRLSERRWSAPKPFGIPCYRKSSATLAAALQRLSRMMASKVVPPRDR